jgi:hypothetical protein
LFFSPMRARAHACAPFSTVRMPFPTASAFSVAKRAIARADSFATIS